jgi:hypothetical protein
MFAASSIFVVILQRSPVYAVLSPEFRWSTGCHVGAFYLLHDYRHTGFKLTTIAWREWSKTTYSQRLCLASSSTRFFAASKFSAGSTHTKAVLSPEDVVSGYRHKKSNRQYFDAGLDRAKQVNALI